MTRAGQHRLLPALLIAPAVALLLLAACSGGDEGPLAAIEPAPSVADLIAAASDEAPSFVNDPALEALITPDALGLPGRFQLVDRPQREPILALGLVRAAARRTYSSPTTNEILSIDLLQLTDGADATTFFDAFADALADDRGFRAVTRVGVLRGTGESARHINFRLQGDAADAAAVLRRGVVALLTYRRPPGLARAIDIGALLAQIDAVLEAAALPGDRSGG